MARLLFSHLNIHFIRKANLDREGEKDLLSLLHFSNDLKWSAELIQSRELGASSEVSHKGAGSQDFGRPLLSSRSTAVSWMGCAKW